MEGIDRRRPRRRRVTRAAPRGALLVLVLAAALLAACRSARPAPSATGALEAQLEADRRAIAYGINFEYNSASLTEQSEPVLRTIGDVLTRHPDWKLRIEGHTDSIGGAAFNKTLSERRAESVRQALVDRYGIAAARLTTAGLGATVPKDRNDTPEGRARNRRVELARQ